MPDQSFHSTVHIQVLRDMPPKTEDLILCEPTSTQRDYYRQLIETTRKDYNANDSNTPLDSNRLSNIMMQLRKMACHPMLHRLRYTDDSLLPMSKDILRDEAHWDADPVLVLEDMSVLSDFELWRLCGNVKAVAKHRIEDELLEDCGRWDAMSAPPVLIVLSSLQARSKCSFPSSTKSVHPATVSFSSPSSPSCSTFSNMYSPVTVIVSLVSTGVRRSLSGRRGSMSIIRMKRSLCFYCQPRRVGVCACVFVFEAVSAC